jgi:hypothetical protein
MNQKSARHDDTQPPFISTRSEEIVVDRLLAMKEQETKRYIRTDYLKTAALCEVTVDAWCRFKMVQWCYSVVDFAHFSRETVSMSMSYLDRFLGSNSPRSQQVIQDRKVYQLAAMTCLYLAIKIFEPRMIETRLLSDLSRGCYSPEDIKKMEIDIIFDLKWHLNDPSPLSYLMNCLALIPFEHGAEINRVMILDLARYQIELSVLDYKLMTQSASNIAIAALTSSIALVFSDRGIEINQSELLTPMGKIFTSEFQSCSISEISQRLEDLHNREIPGILQRKKNTLSATEDNHLAIKTQQQRRSLSPVCVYT